MKINKVIIICLEGKNSVTESKFFTKICDTYRDSTYPFSFISLEHSTNEKEINKLIHYLKTIILQNTKTNKTKVFIIHDNDDISINKVLDKEISLIQDILCNTYEFKKENILRIFDSKCSIDPFLYCICHHENDINEVCKNKDFIDFTKNNKKSNNDNLWSQLYLYYNVPSKLRGRLKMTFVLHKIIEKSVNSNYVEIIKTIYEIIKD